MCSCRCIWRADTASPRKGLSGLRAQRPSYCYWATAEELLQAAMSTDGASRDEIKCPYLKGGMLVSPYRANFT